MHAFPKHSRRLLASFAVASCALGVAAAAMARQHAFAIDVPVPQPI